MSHFSVLVVLDQKPTKENIAPIMAPWHEFECTGWNDEYVQDVDKTEEAREQYAKDTTGRLRDPEGNYHSFFDDAGEWKPEFSQPDEDTNGLPFLDKGRRKAYVPAGYVEVDVPVNKLMSFAEWTNYYYGWDSVASWEPLDLNDKHKFGYVLVDAKGDVIRCVDRTNPNSKWDGWQIGGRYAGRLAPGYDPETDPDNQETCYICNGTKSRDDDLGREARARNPEYTCNGCNGVGTRAKWPSKWKDVGNTARWGDLDLAELKSGAVSERRKWVEEMVAQSGLTFEEFEIGYASYKASHQVWLQLPEPRPRGSDYAEWSKQTQPNGALAAAYFMADTWRSIETDEGQTIAEWIEATPPLSAYAAVIDGQWCSQGDMGWFGISSNDSDDWNAQFALILDAIRPDQYVAIVDCHI